MNLSVVDEKKSNLQKLVLQYQKSVNIIMTISKILFAVGVIGGALYLLINFLHPSLSMVNVQGIPQKNTGWIIISSSFILSPTLILSLCLNVLAKNLAGVNNSSRLDEELSISDDAIQYSYRIKHQSIPSERYIVTMNFSDIKEITFNNKTKQLTFIGKLNGELVDSPDNVIGTAIIEDIKIQDYFEPSLESVLISKGFDLITTEK